MLRTLLAEKESDTKKSTLTSPWAKHLTVKLIPHPWPVSTGSEDSAMGPLEWVQPGRLPSLSAALRVAPSATNMSDLQYLGDSRLHLGF